MSNIEHFTEKHREWYEITYSSDYWHYIHHQSNDEFVKAYKRSERAWLHVMEELEGNSYIAIDTRTMDGIQAIIAVQSGKQVEYYCSSDEKWEDFSLSTSFRVGILLGEVNSRGDVVKFRLKPKHIVINKVQLIAPQQQCPTVGTNYWFYNPKESNGIATGNWQNDAEDQAIFNNIGIYLEEQHVADYRDVIRDTIRGVITE